MDKNRFEEETQLLLEEDSRPKKGRGRWFLVLLILGGLSYGGYRWWRVARPAAADATAAHPRKMAVAGAGVEEVVETAAAGRRSSRSRPASPICRCTCEGWGPQPPLIPSRYEAAWMAN